VDDRADDQGEEEADGDGDGSDNQAGKDEADDETDPLEPSQGLLVLLLLFLLLVVLSVVFSVVLLMVALVWTLGADRVSWALVLPLAVAALANTVDAVVDVGGHSVEGIVEVGLPSAEHVVLAEDSAGLGGCGLANVDFTNKDFAGVVLKDGELKNLHGSLGLPAPDGEDVETETGETGLVGFDDEVNVDGGLNGSTVGQRLLGDGEDVGILSGVDYGEHGPVVQVNDVTLSRIEGKREYEVVWGPVEGVAILADREGTGVARELDSLGELSDSVCLWGETVGVDLWTLIGWLDFVDDFLIKGVRWWDENS